MLKNYLTVALRNVQKRRGYAAINIIGLSLGIAAAVVIALYARHELTYDAFHAKADRTYQVYKERITPTGTQVTRDTWAPLLARLEQTYPAIETGVRVWTDAPWVQRGAERYQETVTYTDAAFFEVFDLPLARGEAATALRDPYSVVLAEPMARKYFGEADPLGQVLSIGGLDYTVRGVLADVPSNTQFAGVGLLIPLASDPTYPDFADNWNSSFLNTFVVLAEGSDPRALEAQFPALVADIWDGETAGRTNFKMEALPDLYDATTGSRRYAYILLAVALATILIASVNFINLATARSLDRAREVGMRKVLGARRPQLVGQMLSESVLMSLCALAVGVGLAGAVLPLFNDLFGITLRLDLLRDPRMPLALLGLGLAVGLLSGSYPALFLSRFQPIRSLRGGAQSHLGGRRLRQGLVVFQFALSMLLIVGTVVMWKQVQYMKHHDLAIDRDNVLAIPVEVGDFTDPDVAASRLETFKRELAALSAVQGVASSAHVPGQGYGSFTFAYPEDGGDDPRRLRWTAVDEQYFEAYGIRLVEGRAFMPGSEADREGALILNEAALRDFGWTSGLGKTVRLGDTEVEVVGVVEDYHYESLQNAVAPLLHFYRPPEGGVHNFVSVRLRTADYAGTLAAIAALWKELDPSRVFAYTFVDAAFDALYRTQDRLVTVAGVFALLAVAIACLGLIGLAALVVVQRTKEIGVRKVLGASVPSVVGLLSWDFLVLVGAAFVLAAPVAYVLMDRWLDDFAYRVALGPEAFALSGGLVLLIAFLCVGFQAMRAALADPVESLRYE